MKRLDLIKYLVPIILAGILLVTCRRNYEYPGLEYMPEMIHSLAYEYQKDAKNTEEEFNDWATLLKPVEGTIPVGQETYHLPNDIDGYNEAATITSNPVELTEEVLLRGQEIYTIHCMPCHGPKGTGEGSAVVGSEYRLAKPPINFANPQEGYLTPGRMFHVITYGRNLMGSYASQVSVEDRWKVIHYVQSLNESTSADVVEPEGNVADDETAAADAGENGSEDSDTDMNNEETTN